MMKMMGNRKSRRRRKGSISFISSVQFNCVPGYLMHKTLKKVALEFNGSAVVKITHLY